MLKKEKKRKILASSFNVLPWLQIICLNSITYKVEKATGWHEAQMKEAWKIFAKSHCMIAHIINTVKLITDTVSKAEYHCARY